MMRTDLSNAEYHADDSISSSDVKMVASKSLAHWKAKVYKSSPVFDLGTAVHAMVLESEKNLIVRGPEDRRGNKWKDAYAEAEANGQLLLTEADYDLAADMAHSLMMHPVGQRMSGPSVTNEASFFATDPDTGLSLKTRPDSFWGDGRVVFDIKTTQAADPRSFGKEVLNYGYDIQAAFYMHVMNLAGLEVDTFIFACVEKTAPYACSVNMLSGEYLAYGRARMRAALAQIANACKTGVYDTGWSTELNLIQLPGWIQAPADFN